MTAKTYPSPSRSGLETARRFFSGTAASYENAVYLWTAGLDWLWKKRMTDKVPAFPQGILDQGCGTGLLTFRLAKKFPATQIIGVELHREYIARAVQRAMATGQKNVRLIQGRAEDVVLKKQFACITSSYLIKYAVIEELVRGAKAMLGRGGILIIHDFTYPQNPFAARILGFYFRFMQIMGRRGFPEWEIVFHELEHFIRQSRWVPELVTSLEEQGFSDIRVERITMGMATIVSAKSTG